MDIDTIKKIAAEAGISEYDLYGMPRLQSIGGDMMGFVKSDKLTPYGESMVKFANLVEVRTMGDNI